jgi:protein required for attachment to host cells
MPTSTLPKELEAQRFAKQLKVVLTSGLQQHRFDKLALIAPAHFLGVISKHLGQQLQGRLLIRLSKDLTHADKRSLRHQLDNVFDAIGAEEHRRVWS